jgi:hypothetical protein
METSPDYAFEEKAEEKAENNFLGKLRKGYDAMKDSPNKSQIFWKLDPSRPRRSF